MSDKPKERKTMTHKVRHGGAKDLMVDSEDKDQKEKSDKKSGSKK